MSTVQRPLRHHYIPVFYLKRWAGQDGRVVVFSRPYGPRVKAKRKHPNATAFEPHLYSIPGGPPELSERVEELFMQPVDSAAADALTMMEAVGHPLWTSRLRSGWTRFLMSLLFRGPETLAEMKQQVARDWRLSTPEDQKRYAEMRKAGDPETLHDFLANTSQEETDQFALRLTLQMIDHRNIGTLVNSMVWSLWNVPDGFPELLTSDRPLIMTNGLRPPTGHLALPVGPRRLFIATADRGLAERIRAVPPLQLVRDVNVAVVESARRLVFARDETQARFISNRMGRNPTPSILTQAFGQRQTALH